MPGSLSKPKVAFLVATSRDVGQRVAQLLAMGELMGPSWLRGTIQWIHLLPNMIMRVVLSVPHADLNKVLSLDNFVHLYKYQHEGHNPLKVGHIPPYLYADGWPGGPPRSNMPIAKSLAELLLLLLKAINPPNEDLLHWKDKFEHAICRAGYHNKPPVLSDGECEALMEMADAWRDHILAVWARPGLRASERFSRQPALTEKVLDEEAPEEPGKTYIRFKPSDFPKLVASPSEASGEASSEPPCPFKPVAPVDKNESYRLWKVAWLDQTRQARMWLGCGASPQSLANRD